MLAASPGLILPFFTSCSVHRAAANTRRRQMTKSQIAMVAAMGFTTAPVANPDGRTRGRQDEGKGKAAKAAVMGQGRQA
jgi:hypothetical protein